MLGMYSDGFCFMFYLVNFYFVNLCTNSRVSSTVDANVSTWKCGIAKAYISVSTTTTLKQCCVIFDLKSFL